MKFLHKRFWLALTMTVLGAYPLMAQFTNDANGTSFTTGNIGAGTNSNSARQLYVYTNNDQYGIDVRNYYNTSNNKFGLYALVASGSGTNYGVYAQATGSSNWAGYFRGRGYFQDNVGIGTQVTPERLSIGGSLHLTGAIKGKKTGTTNANLTIAANTWTGDGAAINMYGNNETNAPGQLTLIAGNGTVGAGNNGNGTGVRFLDYNGSSWDENMVILNDGKVGIGTDCVPTGFTLGVNGSIICEELKVQISDQFGCWPDYVFDSAYDLRPLSEVETYIQANQHLPDVPAAEEVDQEGIHVGEMNAVLLRKIEELTLYVIDLQKQVDTLQSKPTDR